MGKYTGSVFDAFDISQALRRLIAGLDIADLAGGNWRRKGKQSSGVPIDIIERLGGGGRKQAPGFGVDVINQLREVSNRLDKLAEFSGVSSAELRLATRLGETLRAARAAGIDREVIAKHLKEELERAFAGK